MLELFKKRWVYHSLIWLSIATVFFVIDWELGDSIKDIFTEVLLILSPIMFIAYSGFWAKKKFFDQRNYLLYILSIIVIAVISLGIFELIKPFGVNAHNSIVQNLTNIIFALLFATGLQYFKRGIISQHQLQELRAKTAQTELNALKAQINPHFLFNTLNNLYAINQIDSEKGSEMIMELSDVMRYHLEFSKMGTIRLEDELQLIKSYIKLETLRLTDHCKINLDMDNIDGSLQISPLLFLPFIENAFKHGTHPVTPSFVNIRLESNGRDVRFQIENSIIENRKVVKTNIGMENTRRRLELIYPDNHNLSVSQTEQSFSVNLDINL